MQMHNGDTLALEVVRERYLRDVTENMGSTELTELMEPYKDPVYDANITSGAKTTAQQCFGGGHRRGDRDRDGGGDNRHSFKTARPERETLAPWPSLVKDSAGECKAKAEAPVDDKAK
eukprot:jgi/Tetstr1/445702/TSEL_003501.t1